MLKVLIADDEPKIRRGLCSLIEGFVDIDLNVCALAGDGEEALQLAAKHKPDLLLLDISMPHMNGLTLLEELSKDTSQQFKAIIISGYDDFLYAQKGIALNAFSYLLKPIDENELYENLKKAAIQLQQERDAGKRTQYAINQFRQNKEQLKSIFFDDCINGTLTGRDLREQSQFWFDDFSNEKHLILAKLSFDILAKTNREERELILFACSNIMEESVKALDVKFVHYTNGNICIVITNQKPMTQVLENMQQTIGQIYDVQCDIECSGFSNPSEIKNTCEILLNKINAKDSQNTLARKAKKYMDENYANSELSLNDLATKLAISPPYLCRMLKLELKTTFVEYITEKRIEKAIQLLREDDLKLSYIANKVGFASQHYFSTVFRKHKGVSPSTYKQKTNNDV